MQRYFINLNNNKTTNILDTLMEKLSIPQEKALKLILQGSVWIKDLRIKDPSFPVKNDEICINKPDKIVKEFTLEKNHIKYEDASMMIVYKEKDIYSCATCFSDIDNIVYGVQKYYQSLGIDYHAAPINRLDKPTQGLLFFAKDKETEKKLYLLFSERGVKKLYLALTPAFAGVKVSYFIDDILEWRGKKKRAQTFIKFIKERDKLYYFMVYPLTGRNHQIRKHFQNYLVPICGDHLHGGYDSESELKLVCFYYRFKHPISNQKMTISFLEEKYQCE